MLNTQAALGRRGQQNVLGLDPAHRGGELPGKQLDEQLAGQFDGSALPGDPVLDDGPYRLGRHDLEDRAGEIGRQFEGAGDEVGHVASHEAVGVQVGRDERLQALAELRHAGTQDPGVEGHVDSGHEHEGVLAAARRGSGA